jgi:hypothetical protein
VPCAADFLNQDLNLANATIQFLIFNEFEQRFSTSTKVNCYREVQLADIDTLPGPAGNLFSIFSIGTQGTLTGQSRLRAVAGPDEDGYQGRAVMMVLTENWASGICGPEEQVGGASGGWTKSRLTQLCVSDADCETDEVCDDNDINGGYSTTGNNVQYQGSREQGDRIIVPIP